MDLFAVVDQVIELLRSRGRVSYRALRVQFQLDDESLDALKAELIEVHQIAVDQAGTMLVWTGDGGALSEPPPRIPRLSRPSHEPNRAFQRPNAASSPCCFVISWIPPCWQASSTRKSGARWCGHIKHVRKVIQRYDGHIAQYLGDGLLVYRISPGTRRRRAPGGAGWTRDDRSYGTTQ